MMAGSLKPELLRCTLQKSPAATALYSGRRLSMLPFNFNQFASSKLRINYVPQKFNIFRTTTSPLNSSYNYSGSSLQVVVEEEEEEVNSNPFVTDHHLNINFCPSLNFITADQVFDIKKKLFEKLISLFLYGLLCFTAMAMFKHSAFAASYGIMGGSSSSSKSSYTRPASSKSSTWSSSPSSISSRRRASSKSSSSSSLSSYSSPEYSPSSASQWWSSSRCISCNGYIVGRTRSTTTTTTCNITQSDSTCFSNSHIQQNNNTTCNCNKEVGWSDAHTLALVTVLFAPLKWIFDMVEIILWTTLLFLITMALIGIKKGCQLGMKDQKMRREKMRRDKQSEKGSVFMLQVGLLDKGRELQRKLNRIAQIADTSVLSGLNFVLKEVVKALLQRYDSCHYSYLSRQNPPNFGFHFTFHTVQVDSDEKDKCSKSLFEFFLTRELGRYDKDEETFANVDGVKYEKEAVSKAYSYKDNDYSVVTILVLVRGTYKIKSWESGTQQVEAVLQYFESIPKNDIQSLKVLWTPQKEDEVVSEHKLKRDFPLMKPVKLSSGLVLGLTSKRKWKGVH